MKISLTKTFCLSSSPMTLYVTAPMVEKGEMPAMPEPMVRAETISAGEMDMVSAREKAMG